MTSKTSVETDFPFRNIPRFAIHPLIHRQANLDKLNPPSKKHEIDPSTVLPQLKAGLKATDAVFNETTPATMTAMEKKKLKTFTTPLPRCLHAGENKYEVVKELTDGPNGSGNCYAKVRHTVNHGTFTAKLQLRKKPKSDVDFNKERHFLVSIRPKVTRDSYVAAIRDMGFDEDFKFLIFEDFGLDLMFYWTNYRQNFDTSTAYLITYHTFQAVKQLHSLDYLHLDYRPSSFAINAPFQLKIVDFGRVTPKRSKQKVNFRLDRFSPLRWHTKEQQDADEYADYESWLYTIIFVTCAGQLSWGSDKEKMVKPKTELMLEDKGCDWTGSCPMLCLVPYLMRTEKTLEAFIAKIEYLFSIDGMKIDDSEELPWGSVLPEVSTSRRRKPKQSRSFAMKSDADFEPSPTHTQKNKKKNRKSKNLSKDRMKKNR